MKIGSLNTKKRLGNPIVQRKFLNWVLAQNLNYILIQEGRKSKTLPITIPGFTQAGGDEDISFWVRDGNPLPVCEHPYPWVLVSKLGETIFFNVHLSPSSSKARREQFNTLSSLVDLHAGNPIVIAGDFNAAPNLEDGLYGKNVSPWTSPSERTAFHNMCEHNKLVDVLNLQNNGKQEFTLERNIRGKTSRFRCDLVLVSQLHHQEVRAKYDHSIRTWPTSFTDHSAIVFKLEYGLHGEPRL